VNKLQIMVTK